jgi:threonine/homoserine/homoserine lactone efflux protein
MPAESLWSLLAAAGPELAMLAGIAVVLTVTPGPDTFLVLRNALTGGSRCGFMTACGIASGLLFHALLAGLGLSAVLVHSAQAYAVVRWCGAAYLIWLGVKALAGVRRAGGLRAGPADEAAPAPALQAEAPGRRKAYCEGLVTNVLNPKVAVFYLAVLPQIMGARPEIWRAVWFAAAHLAATVLWFALLSKGCGRAGRLLRPVVMRRLDAAAGGLMLLFGVRLVLEQGR